MYETKINELDSSKRPGQRAKNYIDNLLIKRIVSSLKPLLREGEHIQLLEIGTGSGQLAKRLLTVEANIDYVGVEPTDTLRNATAINLSGFSNRANIVDSSLPELPNLGDSCFDACLMFHLLEHATDQIQAHIWLDSVFNKLKPGGRVLIVCPNVFDYGAYFYDGDWSHGYPTTTRRIELLGIDTGFDSIEAFDLRANTQNRLMKALMRVASAIMPTELLNVLGKKIFGVSYIGMGIQAALFWRNCWVVLEKPDASSRS
jgi:SAM-dependent methyltransferase